MRAITIITAIRVVCLLGLAFLLPWVAGDWRWVEGWILGAWWGSLGASILLWLYFRDPGLLKERSRMAGTRGEPRSDVVLVLLIFIGFFAWLVVPPLDRRFGWTPRLPLWSEVLGGVLFAGGSYPFFRAFIDNTFLSPVVRVQGERGQRVVDTGVYGFVRHPMYLGAILVFVGGALLLGSVSGVLIGIGLSGVFVVRIFGEEKLLLRDLAGYKEYRRKVRYRLIPRVW